MNRQLVEAALIDFAKDIQGPERLKEAMAYSLLAGGKRIRPCLCLASGEALGLTSDQLLPMAVALEMIHTYSLIHDDLPAMDNDDLRRGKPTNHVVFGQAMAILAGDALLNEAMFLLMKHYGGTVPGAEAMTYIAQRAGSQGMIGGQVLDIAAEGKTISLEELKTLQAGKTGALIQAALAAPALLAQADTETMDRLECMGLTLGLLFQVQDDVLDVESDEATMGKTMGKDQRDEKSTYVSLLGLDESKQLIDRYYQELEEDARAFGAKGTSLLKLIQRIYTRDH